MNKISFDAFPSRCHPDCAAAVQTETNSLLILGCMAVGELETVLPIPPMVEEADLVVGVIRHSPCLHTELRALPDIPAISGVVFEQDG